MILDSCILIDLSRENPQALAFLEGLSTIPSISVVTATEILCGVKNAREERLFEQLFQAWKVVDVNLRIARLAARYLKDFRASHGLDMIDAFIAATAMSHECDLVTLNLKHFPMFEGIARPY